MFAKEGEFQLRSSAVTLESRKYWLEMSLPAFVSPAIVTLESSKYWLEMSLPAFVSPAIVQLKLVLAA